MCGICNVVNCIRRNLCGGCRTHRNTEDCGCNSRYAQPRTNIVCANQQNDCYKPCCGDDDYDCNCRRNNHHHDNCCE